VWISRAPGRNGQEKSLIRDRAIEREPAIADVGGGRGASAARARPAYGRGAASVIADRELVTAVAMVFCARRDGTSNLVGTLEPIHAGVWYRRLD
jgi:hypothetical protein